MVIFQVCWFGSVIGAAGNLEWLGPLLVLVTVPLQIFLLTENYRAELLFVIVCVLAGFALETGMIASNVYLPVHMKWGLLCPPWMAALWCNFALLVSISLRWLQGKYSLAFFLGGLAGPVAYWGGGKLGAITVAASVWQGYAPLAFVWALALPALVYLHNRMVRFRA